MPKKSEYRGEFVSGNPNGLGVSDDTEFGGAEWIGELEDYVPNGQGTYIYKNGDKYVGEVIDGFPDGQGILVNVDGSVFIGTFEGGVSSNGTFTDTDGDEYIGDVINCVPTGEGTYYYSDGSFHNGNWDDGQLQGHGSYTDQHGGKFIGEFVDSSVNGQGSYEYSDGSTFVGSWVDDEFQGQGIFTDEDGNQFTGRWNDNKFSGQISIINDTREMYVGSGDQYIGSWNGRYEANDIFVSPEFYSELDGMRNGQGCYTFSDGSIYTGEFHHNEIHGLGRLEHADGEIEYGKWVSGEFKIQLDFNEDNDDIEFEDDDDPELEQKQDEAQRGTYILAWVILGVVSSIASTLLGLIIDPLFITQDYLIDDTYFIISPLIGGVVWFCLAVLIYSSFSKIIISKVIPWIFGLGGLGLMGSLYQTHLMFALLDQDANLNNFTLVSVLAFVGSVCGFMWYFKNNKSDQYYGKS